LAWDFGERAQLLGAEPGHTVIIVLAEKYRMATPLTYTPLSLQQKKSMKVQPLEAQAKVLEKRSKWMLFLALPLKRLVRLKLTASLTVVARVVVATVAVLLRAVVAKRLLAKKLTFQDQRRTFLLCPVALKLTITQHGGWRLKQWITLPPTATRWFGNYKGMLKLQFYGKRVSA
jgi:hypothetical protein